MSGRVNEAWKLTNDNVQDKGLLRHILSVGAAMRFYAELLEEDEDYWETIGLLHDFDWEIHPDLDRHPIDGAPILRRNGWDEEIIRIILSHYSAGTGVEREKPVDFALLACDEITGLITAVALVRPSRSVHDVKIKSIRKKFKDSRFAAAVNRDEIIQGAGELGIELWEHVAVVLASMQQIAPELGLEGQPVS